MADRLEEINKVFRERDLAKNKMSSKNEYNESHPNAISDGDEHGKADDGSLTDIKSREKMLSKNKFNSGKEYNESTFDKF